jgi:ribonuclease D
MAQLKLCANEHNISPTNIASRKDIEKIILGETEIPLLSSWRYKLAGKKIQNLLQGKYSLEIKDGKVQVTENNSSAH